MQVEEYDGIGHTNAAKRWCKKHGVTFVALFNQTIPGVRLQLLYIKPWLRDGKGQHVLYNAWTPDVTIPVDFEFLRKVRREAMSGMLEAVAKEYGMSKNDIRIAACHIDGCYCACPDGPCEHDFDGWHNFDDGRGGEQVCRKCGMGAMSHDLRTGE